LLQQLLFLDPSIITPALMNKIKVLLKMTPPTPSGCFQGQ